MQSLATRCTYCGFFAKSNTVLNRHIGHRPACQAKAAEALKQQVLAGNDRSQSPASNTEANDGIQDDSQNMDADTPNPADIEGLDDAAHQVDMEFRERETANVQAQAVPNRNPAPGLSPASRYVQEYPRPAGIPISNEKTPSKFQEMEKTYLV